MLVDWIVKGERLPLGGRSWHLLATYRVLLDTEKETGIDMLSSVRAVTEPSAKVFRVLLWAMLRRQDRKLTEHQAGAMLTARNLPAVKQAVVRAFVSSMPPPQKRKKSGAADDQSKKLPTGWPETQAVAHMELHLSDKEWLNMVPLQFHLFRKKFIEQQRREELLVGQICSKIVNFSGRAKRPSKPEDFITHRFPIDEEQEEESGVLTGEMIMSQFAMARGKRR